MSWITRMKSTDIIIDTEEKVVKLAEENNRVNYAMNGKKHLRIPLERKLKETVMWLEMIG